MLTLKMTIQTEFNSKIQSTNNRFVDSNRNYKDGLGAVLFTPNLLMPGVLIHQDAGRLCHLGRYMHLFCSDNNKVNSTTDFYGG